MTIALIGSDSIGFTGSSCADFARAYTTWRWDQQGGIDGWSVVSCQYDLLPTSGDSFTATMRNVLTEESSTLGPVTLTQMDSYRTYPLVNNSDSSLPPAAEIAAVWSAGFSFVVLCFFIARSIGAVLSFLRRRR